MFCPQAKISFTLSPVLVQGQEQALTHPHVRIKPQKCVMLKEREFKFVDVLVPQKRLK